MNQNEWDTPDVFLMMDDFIIFVLVAKKMLVKLNFM